MICSIRCHYCLKYLSITTVPLRGHGGKRDTQCKWSEANEWLFNFFNTPASKIFRKSPRPALGFTRLVTTAIARFIPDQWKNSIAPMKYSWPGFKCFTYPTTMLHYVLWDYQGNAMYQIRLRWLTRQLVRGVSSLMHFKQFHRKTFLHCWNTFHNGLGKKRTVSSESVTKKVKILGFQDWDLYPPAWRNSGHFWNFHCMCMLHKYSMLWAQMKQVPDGAFLCVIQSWL